jgi:hypothetical protein
MEGAIATVNQVWGTVLQVVTIATAPACVAVALSIGSTQAVKMLEHRLPILRKRLGKNKLRRGEIWVLAWVVTAVTFPAVCWVMGVPVRPNLVLGFVAGFASPFIPALLKRVGLDLDSVLKRAGE